MKKRQYLHEQECGLYLIWEPDQDIINPKSQVECVIINVSMQDLCTNCKFHRIIAVHAPRQEWRQNWTSKEAMYCWLEEAIPKIIPTARVSSFGYIEGPESAANSLLSELFQERWRLPEGKLKISSGCSP
jgi:hypothetical protein